MSLLGDGIGFHHGFAALIFMTKVTAISLRFGVWDKYIIMVYRSSSLNMFLTPPTPPRVSPRKSARGTLVFGLGAQAPGSLPGRMGGKAARPRSPAPASLRGVEAAPSNALSREQRSGLD